MLPDEIFTFAISIICPSPQKSSAARKVYRADRFAKGSPFGGAGERSETERARMLPENHKHSDSIALTEGLLIAARRLSGDGLALSVIASQCHLSHRERLSPAGRRNVFVRVPFRRKVCYTGLAVHPVILYGRG